MNKHMNKQKIAMTLCTFKDAWNSRVSDLLGPTACECLCQLKLYQPKLGKRWRGIKSATLPLRILSCLSNCASSTCRFFYNLSLLLHMLPIVSSQRYWLHAWPFCKECESASPLSSSCCARETRFTDQGVWPCSPKATRSRGGHQ